MMTFVNNVQVSKLTSSRKISAILMSRDFQNLTLMAGCARNMLKSLRDVQTPKSATLFYAHKHTCSRKEGGGPCQVVGMVDGTEEAGPRRSTQKLWFYAKVNLVRVNLHLLLEKARAESNTCVLFPINLCQINMELN